MAQAYSVTQINNYIKNMFARDFVLNRITVKGEVSNCKYHSSGHIYFTLKDSGGAIACVMFAGNRSGLDFRMADGQQIEATGQITVYEKTGQYQLYVRSCVLAGAGALYEKFLKLRQELEDMGMFDEMYKKPIPSYCRRIGIVTAATGAAIRDIINVSHRRNPYVELTLYPAQVQGEGAAESIVKGIRKLDQLGMDVIIVGRGGGSIEDLWAFNEEIVARAIFEAETPIISAVGHETDFTIADFVSDMRAPTPSAAAELANFEYEVFMQELDAEKSALQRAVDIKLRMLRMRLDTKRENLRRLSPQAVLETKKLRLADYRGRLESGFGERLADTKKRLELCAVRLDGMSPLKKMSGGYAYISDSSGKAVLSVGDIGEGERITSFVRDGKISSVVVAAERLDYGK